MRVSAAAEKTASSASKPGSVAVTPSILRLIIATILAGTLCLCSLAIERVTGNRKSAALREHPQERTVMGSPSLSTPKDIQGGWSIGIR
jgi:hypothetical protein